MHGGNQSLSYKTSSHIVTGLWYNCWKRVKTVLFWLCSVMAAFIAGMGYYTVMWGQLNEDKGVGEEKDDKSNDLSSAKVPLLDEESRV